LLDRCGSWQLISAFIGSASMHRQMPKGSRIQEVAAQGAKLEV
jgi:hypothetical protein